MPLGVLGFVFCSVLVLPRTDSNGLVILDFFLLLRSVSFEEEEHISYTSNWNLIGVWGGLQHAKERIEFGRVVPWDERETQKLRSAISIIIGILFFISLSRAPSLLALR